MDNVATSRSPLHQYAAHASTTVSFSVLVTFGPRLIEVVLWRNDLQALRGEPSGRERCCVMYSLFFPCVTFLECSEFHSHVVSFFKSELLSCAVSFHSCHMVLHLILPLVI